MKPGFVSAIFPNWSLEEVVAFAAAEKIAAVELMCWPPGKADRRYAGVTHVDAVAVASDPGEARRVLDVCGSAGVSISGLGYYPNPLQADDAASRVAIEHLGTLFRAANALGVAVVNTFVGRDRTKTVDDNWPRFLEVWKPLVRQASDLGVQIGIENCPMLFTADEWPGGNNLAHTPGIWRRMFSDIPDPCFGLNYDPSHLVWMQMDYLGPVAEFADRIHHVHAKDVVIDREALSKLGVLAFPNLYHRPVLPGRGTVDWPKFLAALAKVGYDGPVCLEVEDREFEKTDDDRKQAVRLGVKAVADALPK